MVNENAVEEPTDQVAAKNGKLTFSKLKPGLYLIVQEASISNYNDLNSFLISVPTWNDETSSYDYDRTAKVKNDITKETEPSTEGVPPDDEGDDTIDDDEGTDNEDDYSSDSEDDSSSSRETLPQTGQLWWPLPLLLCAGLILMLVGRKIRR